MTAQTGRDPGPGPAPSASAGCSLESTEIDTILGHRFKDESLLSRALTHASADPARSNERLEFLGDRVLGLIVAETLHALYPGDSEGAMALKYNALVRQDACARAAQAAGLGPHLILGKSETGGGRRKPVILACACEAVIAALYLDGGTEAARAFVSRYWADQFAALSHDMRDAKTMLQERVHARKTGGEPQYREVGRTGPDHAPRFKVEVSVSGVEPQIGEGGSKREAEQDAAKKMLDRIS